MAKTSVIYVREVDPNTFLHFSSVGDSTCLRDYSRGSALPPGETRGYTPAQIQAYLRHAWNIEEPAPRRSVSDTGFWHQRIAERNDWYGLPGNEGDLQFRRLLDRFQFEVGKALSCGDPIKLQSCVAEWLRNFETILGPRQGFNHWDDDDCSAWIDPSTGIGWTSAMLEHCRERGGLDFISVDKEDLDFALLSMDLNLGISSANNPFRAGVKDFIKPDGLGIRKDNSFCVLEVKAESDCPELFRATVQALCGALAVVAKRDAICLIAQVGRGRRPAAAAAAIPMDHPSLGLYVLVDADNFQIPEDNEFRNRISLLLRSFLQIREIVYFPVDPRSREFPSALRVGRIFPRA